MDSDKNILPLDIQYSPFNFGIIGLPIEFVPADSQVMAGVSYNGRTFLLVCGCIMTPYRSYRYNVVKQCEYGAHPQWHPTEGILIEYYINTDENVDRWPRDRKHVIFGPFVDQAEALKQAKETLKTRYVRATQWPTYFDRQTYKNAMQAAGAEKVAEHLHKLCGGKLFKFPKLVRRATIREVLRYFYDANTPVDEEIVMQGIALYNARLKLKS